MIEFVYRGQVVIPGQRLTHVCRAAHGLGIYGLVDFLPHTSDKLDDRQESGHHGNHESDRLMVQSMGMEVAAECGHGESQNNAMFQANMNVEPSEEATGNAFRSTLDEG